MRGRPAARCAARRWRPARPPRSSRSRWPAPAARRGSCRRRPRSPVGEDQRVVGGGVHLDRQHPLALVERVAHRAVHLGHAAQRVGVLDARGRCRACDAAISLPASSARRCSAHGHLAGVRPRAAISASSKAAARPLHRLQAHGADDVRRGGQPLARRAAPGRPSAAMSCVPLRRASPSLASSATGARPAALECLARRHRSGSLDVRPRPRRSAPAPGGPAAPGRPTRPRCRATASPDGPPR